MGACAFAGQLHPLAASPSCVSHAGTHFGTFSFGKSHLNDILLKDPVANWVLAANLLKSTEYIKNLKVEVISFWMPTFANGRD